MRWNVKLALSAVWVFLGAGSYLILPELAPFFLPLTMLLPILWYPEPGLMRHLWGKSLLARLLAVASAYLLINAQWSTAPTLAYIGVGTFFAASVAVHVVSRTMPYLARDPIRAMSMGFYSAYIICALLLGLEVVFRHPFHLYFFNLFPTLIPQMPGVAVEDGILKALPSHYLNKPVAALAFLLWPALLIASHLSAGVRKRVLLLLCMPPVVVAIAASDHESSKLALAGGALAFALCWLAPRLVRSALTAAWVFACVAVVPLASWAYGQQLQKALWLQPSAQHRIVIWGVTSSKVAEAPFLGHGMVAAREFGMREKEHPTYVDGSPYMLSTGPHAHNVYLQVWFDTGAIGVALLLAIGLFALSAISRVSVDLQPALYAAFATNALMAASSFSIWTRWFLASYAFSTIFAVMAWRFASTANPDPPAPDYTQAKPPGLAAT